MEVIIRTLTESPIETLHLITLLKPMIYIRI